MEINERKNDMPNKIKNNDTLVSATDMLNKKDKELSEVWTSVDDAPREVQKEYESYIKKQEEVVDDLDNQTYSEGEKYD